MATVVNVITQETTTVVNVVTEGAIISASGPTSSSQLSDNIDGFWVIKGSGNSAPSIEVGDRIHGWLDENTFLAGTVTALPVSNANINSAIQGTQFQ